MPKPHVLSVNLPRVTRAIGAAFVILGLSACANTPGWSTKDQILGALTPYKVEIVQGNVISKEKLDQVKVGMSRSQVRDILGSPLLADAFHGDRWDYIFMIRRKGVEEKKTFIVAQFEGDTLKTINASMTPPTEQEFVQSISVFSRSGDLPKMELTEAERKALPAPVRPPAPVTQDVGPARAYPPLEPQS